MPTYTQEGRFIAIDTPLGEDFFLLQGFSGHEGVSGLFNFRLELLSEEPRISFDKIIGKKVTIAMAQTDDTNRYFNGFVSRFAQTGKDERFTHYRAEVVPWLWFLTRTADCRIFQNMTVPDIVAKIFKDLGFTDYKIMLQGSFEPREYCVQYRETDFNFVSRMMEQYGIFYFFEHEEGKHTLVLANSPSSHKPCPGQPKARYEEVAGNLEDEDVVTSIQMEQELRPGKYALADYNFETPSTSLAATAPSMVKVGGNDKFEIYDYPGEYEKRPEGDDLAKIRMQEAEASHLVVTGTGNCRAFAAGYRFDLTDHDRDEMNQAYVLTEVRHAASVGESYASGGTESGGDQSYSNSFTCIPQKVPFRPARVTPKPVVQGAQTAVVVGKEGEEIWVDKYGRVKVQFHWDREGKKDENSSCWIRVAQNWAGKRWGFQFIPRIGQEVIVEYLEGDPDQPIIAGCVYNAENMPPYDLPAQQTKSAIKTLSSKGGGGFNEFRFEDKKGEEQIFIHAERNQDVRVEKNVYEWIGEERHLIVKKDQFEQVDGDKHLTIKGDQNEKITGTVSLDAGQDLQQKVGMKHGVEAGQEIHLKGGMNVIIEAGMSITLKAGGGFVVVGPAGVTLSGTPIMLNSGGSAGSGSGCSPDTAKLPKEADKAKPGEVSKVAPPPPPPAPASPSPAAAVLKQSAKDGTPFCEKCEAAKKAAAGG